MRSKPVHIGVFDSGVGGLTVLKALKEELPSARFTYLGDMARLPYGTKSEDVIVQYSLKAVDMLVNQGVDAVVIACNTASSAAVPAIQAKYPALYILDVIEPTVNQAIKLSSAQNFLVLATERTVSSGVYTQLIQAQSPFAQVAGIATPLLVSMAEEGWANILITEQILAHYIPQKTMDSKIDTVILGCTHFPFFERSFRRFFGNHVNIIDSASPTALALKEHLVRLNEFSDKADLGGEHEARYLVTDSPERFLRIAAYFLKDEIRPENIEFVHFS
jgi:glutamate racemase